MSKKWYDEGQVNAIRTWIQYSFAPGGCSTCIIQGDYEGAFARAHPHLKTDDNFTFREMYDNLRSTVPPSLLDQDVSYWPGLQNCSKSQRLMLEFESGMIDDNRWLEQVLTKSLTPSN